MSKTENSILAKQLGEFLYNGDISAINDYIYSRRWFRRKSEVISKVIVRDYAILNDNPIELLSIIEIFYESYHSEIYYLPLMIQSDPYKQNKFEIILTINLGGRQVLLYDAFSDIRFCANLLKLIKLKKQVKSLMGVFSFYPTDVLNKFNQPLIEEQIKLISTEQSNTSINYCNSFIMKNYRNIEYGINPDFEISYFLTKQTKLRNIPALLGYIEYQNEDKLTATAAVLQEFITNKGDCWNYTLINLEDIYRIAMRNILISDNNQIKLIIKEYAHNYINEIKRLGEITGAFHKALMTDSDDEAFRAEWVTDEDVDHWLSTMIASADDILTKIQESLPTYSEDVQNKVSIILKNKEFYLDKLRKLNILKNVRQQKIRVHGDYHLGQVLKTEDDFVILDFEGEPIKSMEERRSKFLPQKDIAGMLRSINYATCASLTELDGIGEQELDTLRNWASIWEKLCSQAFLEGYMGSMKEKIPDEESFYEILTVFQTDKALYELAYEINNRPDWLRIPVEYLKSVVS